MTNLYFTNPTFRDGVNVSVRRGVKWDMVDKSNIEICDTENGVVGKAKNVETYVICFADLQAADLVFEHDPACTTPLGLLKVMREVYPGFRDYEIVTVISFEVDNG